MSKIKNSFLALVLCFFLFDAQVGIADEADLFTTTASPDVLLILDISGSMGWTPAGNTLYNSGTTCPIDTTTQYYPSSGSGHTHQCVDPGAAINWQWNGPMFGDDTSCAGPFYSPSSHSGPSGTTGWSGTGPTAHPWNCSRYFIAQRAIFDLLDANNDNVIDVNDYNMLGVRMGYMRFLGCDPSVYGYDTAGDYTSGCIQKKVDIGGVDASTNTYQTIYNTIISAAERRNYCSTPLVATLVEAKSYLDANKASDTYAACRQKFIIFVTDGEDTLACGGPRSEGDANAYMNRKSVVAQSKALAAAGYRVFWVGFGADMPLRAQNTLNWAAYYGGTYNPNATQTTAGTITVSSNPCAADTTNDPASVNISGYAFLATNPADLIAALTTAINSIQVSSNSFSVSSVSSSRTALDNHLYAGSFLPSSTSPFWPGYLTESTVNSDGSLTAGWEAGGILNGNSARNISTYQGGSVIPFQGTAWGNWAGYLGVDTNTAKIIIPYIRGDATPDNWKLGDIFHSSPITIGQPNPYFEDPRDVKGAYDIYRTGNSIKNRAKLVVAGANDGQLHAFDGTAGSEVWSFIPPNLVPKLQYLSHTTNPSGLVHQFFVDGPISAGDVWLGSGTGTAKSSSDWHTYLVFGEGKGVRDKNSTVGNTSYLWSSSQYCDQNFNPAYVWASNYQYYCGYHGLDVTATGSTPAYKWIINSGGSPPAVSSTHGPYLGEPWSKMAIGKVIISGNETWVGMIGGGYGQGLTAGKGFFVVSLTDGHILWSLTAGTAGYSAMSYVPAAPTIVDTDNDGFIDTAYVGDLAGNMWRFTFCTNAQGATCGTGRWSGGLFFQPSTTVPVYTAATVSRDSSSNLWVFWGTGDKTTPNNTSSSSTGKFYAVKDNSRSGTYGVSNLQDITSATSYTAPTTTQGWYISLGSSGNGEKMLSDPTVFGGMVLFTTYIPYSGTNPCVSAGTSYLYAVAMQNQTIAGAGTFNTGGGLLTSGARSVSVGSGIAAAPTIAQNFPGTTSSLFVSVSGGLGIQGGTPTTLPSVTDTKVNFDQNSGLIKRLGQTGVSTQILHWKDGRVQ